MWDFSYIIPNTLVLMVIAAHYFALPRLSVRLNRRFLQLLALEAAITLMDIVSTLADEMYAELPIWLLWALNMAFFVLFFLRTFAFFRVILDLLRQRHYRRDLLLTSIVCAVSILITLSSVWTGAVFRIDADGYHSGPMYLLLSLCSFFYLALSLAMLWVHSRQLTRFRRNGALSFILILVIGSVVRLLMPFALVMDVFCVLAIIVIYLVFENPNLYLDKHGAFNLAALREKLSELIGYKPYRLLAVGIRGYYDDLAIYGSARMDAGITEIYRYLKREFHKIDVFYIHGGVFVLLGGEGFVLEQARERIAARFLKAWQEEGAELDLNVDFARADESAGFEDAERVVRGILAAMEEPGETDAVLDAKSILKSDLQAATVRALDRALTHKQVEVYLQPLVEAATGRTVGAEALARLRDENGKLIPPLSFIPVAEENGMIHRLGEQVLEKTCEIIKKYDLPAHGIERVTVNLSPVQCLRKDLCSRFAEIIERSGVSPELVPLELTEAMMLDISLVKDQIDALRQSGFPLVLDDYGAGYSNLARFGQYSFRSIKLDMSIVRTYYNSDSPILPTLTRMFHSIGCLVVAEGVETEEMAQALRILGCDLLQGYLFDKPLPAEEFARKYAS